ncbi:MAG TPA: hypothetical protein VF339_02980 [Gammaproteobacteria bacterium]
MSIALESEVSPVSGLPARDAASARVGVMDALLPWRNPVFMRYLRSRLRLRKAIFWYLVTLIVATFIVSLMYTIATNASTPPDEAARGIWIPLLVLQGVILMVKGTGSVSAGLIQDRIDQTLDYQRLTPVSPLRNLAGYLFGLPVLEYAMFALTLPHLAFVAVVGRIPPDALLSVYCSFFVCVVMYHMTGIAAGMVIRRWIFGYMLSILLVLFVNVILPAFVSQLGLRFFQYLSVWPVIGQKVLPVVTGAAPVGPTGNPFLSVFGDVPFYRWSLSPFVFTLLLQGTLILTFGTIAVRRWKSSTRHSLSKPYALAFLLGFIVVLIGNVWPIVTRSYMPFPLFGQWNLEELGEVVAIGLPLVYAYVVWFLCIVLLAIVVPTHDHFVRGIRRAIKHGRPAARLWDDDSPSFRVYGLFTVVAVAGLCMLLREIWASGFFAPFGGPPATVWRLPLALALVVTYTALLFQALGLRRAALAVLLVWFLPILASIVLSARTEGFDVPHAVVHSLSPIAFLLMAGLPADEARPPEALAGELSAVSVGVATGFAAVAVQIIVLWLVWSRRSRASYALCRSTLPAAGMPGPHAAAREASVDGNGDEWPLDAASSTESQTL